jgi:NAD(P)-dependent dehydrogenase (short-subunit alcohol dehydrogenase family)
MEWRNQVAVLTGGSRGIGRATVRLLAQRGAAVCVNYAAQFKNPCRRAWATILRILLSEIAP